MPTYEFVCTICGQNIEVFQRIGDDPLTTCEVCGGALRKVFFPAGIVFRGSGFYKTDSRSGSKSKVASKTGETKSSDSKSSESSESSKSSDSGSSKSSDSSTPSSSEGAKSKDTKSSEKEKAG